PQGCRSKQSKQMKNTKWIRLYGEIENRTDDYNQSYPYIKKSEKTSNLINYLQDKHRITKANYLEHLDIDSE
ncbi:4910_t:CDS:2, partial [Dentiscutata heterogama]